MDVFGMGVLITGDSGVGKSELALELISRGHGLVADDVVELACIAPTTIEGRCPSMLRDYLEVRGLGLLNIRTIFGETASRRKMKLKLIAHLQRPLSSSDGPRLPLDAQSQEILGVYPYARSSSRSPPGETLRSCSRRRSATASCNYAVSTAWATSSIGSSRRCLTTTFSSGLITDFLNPRRNLR
jgi:serine kinase of HPr protein (carbohydrate metabolism regulator)